MLHHEEYMIKAAVFDLWETIATKHVGVSSLLRDRFDIPKTPDYLRKYEESVQLVTWETEEQMARGFLSKFGITQDRASIDFVMQTFRQGVDRATLFEGVAEVLESVKQKGWKLGLLSNTTNFESPVLDRLGVTGLFDAMVFSWQIGALKPGHEAFDEMLGRLRVRPEEAVFIDDNPKNIESAKMFGMAAIPFEGVERLKRSLNSL